MAVVLHVTDDGFDGGAASQLALDGAEDAALLTGDEDAARVCRVVAAVSLVDVGALDLAACKPLGAFDDGFSRCGRRKGCPAMTWHGARTGRRVRGRWW